MTKLLALGIIKFIMKPRNYCFYKEQIGVKELFTGYQQYQPFYTINLLLDKELLQIKKIPKLGVSEYAIVKISKKRGL